MRKIMSTKRGSYFVDETGSVYSQRSNGTMARLKPRQERCGFLRINIGSKTHLVHRLVALGYYGPCPDNASISHLNGNKQDNRPSNLKYETYHDRASRSTVSHGLHRDTMTSR